MSLVFALSCKMQSPSVNEAADDLLDKLYDGVTNAIIEDGFSPPVAARIYSYTFLTFYECLAASDNEMPSIVNTLNGFEGQMPVIEDPDYDAMATAVHAYLNVARALVYKDYLLPDEEDLLSEDQLKLSGISASTASEIADHLLTWAADDNYNETRNKPLYDIPEGWGSWEPTPPNYGTAIEPYWYTIRPFVIDSIEQYVTNMDLNYDTARTSEFHKLAMDVYDAVDTIDAYRIDQAKYWDCNPMVTNNTGHLMSIKKQMNPGGHWLGIAKTVMHDEGLPLKRRAFVYTSTSIAIFDAFIICWNEKYKTNLIRPETYINRYINEEWKPILETPLFPEYTSGHSVISGSASSVLTTIVGDNIPYIDSVNYVFGLPPRPFTSFTAAAEEAALSRLYGGIHYMPAIENGLKQGRATASTVLEHLAVNELIDNN